MSLKNSLSALILTAAATTACSSADDKQNPDYGTQAGPNNTVGNLEVFDCHMEYNDQAKKVDGSAAAIDGICKDNDALVISCMLQPNGDSGTNFAWSVCADQNHLPKLKNFLQNSTKSECVAQAKDATRVCKPQN